MGGNIEILICFRRCQISWQRQDFIEASNKYTAEWKALKSPYYKCKKHNNTSGSDPQKCPFYDELDQLLGHRPLSSVDDNAIDIAFEDPPADVDETSTPSPSGKLTYWLTNLFSSSIIPVTFINYITSSRYEYSLACSINHILLILSYSCFVEISVSCN